MLLSIVGVAYFPEKPSKSQDIQLPSPPTERMKKKQDGCIHGVFAVRFKDYEKDNRMDSSEDEVKSS
jgi:hypothetical protein